MRNPIFVCEDSREGKELFKLLVRRLTRRDVIVWGSLGVSELKRTADVARRQYPDSRIVYVADGDKLLKKEQRSLRDKIRVDLEELGGVGIFVDKNMEDLGRRCLTSELRDQFDRERRKSKKNALRFALDHIDLNVAEAQPELLDVKLILSCGGPTHSSLLAKIRLALNSVARLLADPALF